MKYMHNITVSAFCKPLDDVEAIRGVLESFLPEDLEQEKIRLEEEEIHIEEGKDLRKLSVQTEKQRHNQTIIEHLLSLLSEEQKQEILSQDDRVDEKGALYIRLDKKQLLEGKAELVDHGDCFHIKILLAAFPKTKEKALLVRDKLFNKV